MGMLEPIRDQDMFVAWPAVGDAWRDSGAGGLFVYLIYWGLGHPERASVDVAPHLRMPRARVMPLNGVLARQLWAPPSRSPGPNAESTPKRPGEGWSKELRAAIYMGSTDKSLVRADSGEHLQVCRDDLTSDGDALVHVLDYEYGWPGDILTFLSPRPTGGTRFMNWLLRGHHG